MQAINHGLIQPGHQSPPTTSQPEKPLEIATRPLSGEDSDTVIFNALDEIVILGEWEDKHKACFALLKPCQDQRLPESTRQRAKLFLLRFLETILDNSASDKNSNAPQFGEAHDHDGDQLITRYLKELLIDFEIKAWVYEQDEKKDFARRSEPGSLITSVISVEKMLALQDQEINNKLENIQQIYSYLKFTAENIDEQLLDDVIWVAIEKQAPQVAMAICEMLIDSSDHLEVKKEAQFLLEEIPTNWQYQTTDFFAYLATIATTKNRPQAAYCIGNANFSSASGVKEDFNDCEEINFKRKTACEYWTKAAIAGHMPTIDLLGKLAHDTSDVNELKMILAIFDQVHFPGMEKRKEKIIVKLEMQKITTDQLGHVQLETAIKDRVDQGKTLLLSQDSDLGGRPALEQNKVFKGMRILEPLSYFDNPMGREARKCLDTWLSDTKNQIWLITLYGYHGAGHAADSYAYNNYKNNVHLHTNVVLQEIHALKEQGNSEAATQLEFQLIDVAIKQEMHEDFVKDDKTIYSYFYQLLLDSPVIDDVCKYELKIRQALCTGTMFISDKDAIVCLTKAANTPGRALAAYQLGIVYFLHQDKDKDSPTAAYFLNKAFKEGYVPSEKQNIWLFGLTLEKYEDANRCMSMYKNQVLKLDKSQRNNALALYEWASIAGNQDARYKYLKLRASLDDQEAKKCLLNQSTAQFELGKLYLTRASQLYTKKNIAKAQKWLESAASNGHVEAAILAAYSFHISHQPVNAMKFLEMGIKHGFENEKQNIDENEIPDYLSKIVAQLGPAMMETIFNLSEKLEKGWFPTKVELKLARDLFKIAIEAKYPAALEKLALQQEKREKELQIEVQQKMKELEEEERQRAINLSNSQSISTKTELDNEITSKRLST